MADLASRVASLTTSQRAELTARLTKEAASPAPQAIAIVGVGCRFPGGGVSPEAFWESLVNGVDAIREIPADRWNASDGAQSSKSEPARSRWGSFLDGVDQFDRDFFGLSPREAAHMDPQQRLLLETAWEALEDAGQMTEQLAESATGVFVGVQSHSSDYYMLQAGAQEGLDTYTATGTAHSILANRLSFIFDLRGPSLAIDTACSSSLVAVHLACQSLKTGECDMALAGGVNLMLTPDFHGCLSMMEMMAPDGRCKTFDHRANGFVRGEGCGVVVLKRLADANRDGDPVLAVILGNASNQDGASNGLTAPNGLAQQAVIRRALQVAQVTPDQVSYVETHGTGTELGDPIEVEALAGVLRSGDGQLGPCVLGALKSNIGHLEAASGIAGLIKVALCFKNGMIPGNLHLERVNPHLAAFADRFTLPTTPQPWPRSDKRRVAGISSFGFGGTNAHLVLSEALAKPPVEPAVATGAPLLLPLSARSDNSLRSIAESHIALLSRAGTEIACSDLAYTAARRRRHHDHRICAVGANPTEWISSLRQQLAEGATLANAGGEREVTFVFSGQGGQRAGAGADLLRSEPVFREAIDACDAALRKHLPVSLADEIAAPTSRSRLSRADIGQPAQVALQIALARLWQSFGLQPSNVVGHSLGEIAAAHIAGALSIDDAMTVAFHRGRVLQNAVGLGGMAMVALSSEEAKMVIAAIDPAVSIAAFNSPIACILSGPDAGLKAIVAELQRGSVFARVLDTDYPSHSPLMDRFAVELEKALAGLRPSPPQIPVVSSVTGELSQVGAFYAHYWAVNLRQPVLFAQSVDTLLKGGASTFLEIGPQPVLRMAIEQCETTNSGPLAVAASLGRDRADRHAIFDGVAALYRAGAAIDWSKVSPAGGQCVAMPRYPWNRQRYWLPATVQRANTRHAFQQPDPVPAHWLYEVVWRPSERPASAPSVLAQTNLAYSAATLTSYVAEISAPREEDAALREWLDVTSGRYILEALKKLGADVAAGAVLAKRGFPDHLGVQPRFARLLQRMMGILVSQGILIEEPQQWRLTGQRPAAANIRSPGKDRSEPASDLLTRCGPQLAEVLRGDAEPLSLLFGDDGTSAEAIYRHAAPSKRANDVLKTAVDGWLVDLPKDKRLRILEIGAGTGATSSVILPLLPKERTDYLFTDVSKHFLDGAAQQLADYPFVRYELLDLEDDLADQGFGAGTFDLVIAANVVHATGDLRASLGRLQYLLAVGGVVALLECTTARPWMDLTFGLTDGWWRFTDLDLRQTSPLLAQKGWSDLIRACGFADAVSIPLQGDREDPLFDQALVMARRPISDRTESLSARPRYLILDEGNETATALADQFSVGGNDCVVVTAGEAFEQLAPDAFKARFAASHDFHQLFEAAGADFTAVVYFPANEVPDLSDRCSGLLALVQELGRANVTLPQGLWIVTRGCQVAGDGRATLDQSLLWGFGRGISLEAPALCPVLIDLDPQMGASEAAAVLLGELQGGTAEDQIVVRDRRLVPRLKPLAADELDARPFQVFGRHLITGGLGGIGARLALELVRAGADELVLAANRPLPDRSSWPQVKEGDPDFGRINTVRQIEAAGAKVIVEAVDFSDAHALEGLFARPTMLGLPLRGVWHTAMALAPEEIGVMADSTLRTTISVKARAAFQLHDLTLGHPLDQFVLFSSTTGLWGARGLAHYAAANAYLDSLAHARRSEGLAATVVNWGIWEIMERLSADQQASAKRAGLNPMKASSAFSALKQAIVSGRTQTVVADVDWERFKLAYEIHRRRRFLDELGDHTSPKATPDQASLSHDLGLALKTASSQDRNGTIRALVIQILASVLSLDPREPVDPTRGFFDLGMDSLTSVQLRRRLEGALGCRLSSTVAFKYPTVDTLSQHIDEVIFPHASTSPAVPPQPIQHQKIISSTETDDASEDELFDLLAERLSAGKA